MCGIYGTHGLDVDVEAGLKRIEHRGPDGAGIQGVGTGIHGHVRLSVIDLTEASRQPMKVDENVLSYNGELWNFRELRAELEGLGRVFETDGDTEVVLQALMEFGVHAALEKLEGMFAFAYTPPGGETVIARDRFGKIPVYLDRRGRDYLWSSERKGFPDGGRRARLVPPGTYVNLGTGQVHRYYDLARVVRRGTESDVDLLGLLRAGVRRRMIADAPLCCLISGGLDSSLILALAREENPEVVAYTAFHDLESEDFQSARRLCAELDVELREVQLGSISDQTIEEAIRAIEIPTKAQIEIAVLCVPLARQIARDGFKVCLSGEAADELFGGYGNMMIRGARAGDEEWRQIRLDQVAKMSRGNFIRCNKAFMAGGVECRLPFMDRDLVEHVLSASKAECPPGKGMLKEAARGFLPDWVIDRQKDTFQGGSGVAKVCQAVIANPTRYYNSRVLDLYGPLARTG